MTHVAFGLNDIKMMLNPDGMIGIFRDGDIDIWSSHILSGANETNHPAVNYRNASESQS